MQMNQALFMSSGQCGYVLQPPNMRDDIFDPFDKSTLRGTEPLSISIEVSTSWCGNAGSDPSGYIRFGVREWFSGLLALPAAAPHQTPSAPVLQHRLGEPSLRRGTHGSIPGCSPQDPSCPGPSASRWHPRAAEVTSLSPEPGLHPQANNTRAVPCSLLVTQLLQAPCVHFPCSWPLV